MQPFETEPAILPDRVTTIFEPSGRGLEPHVSTTVARAISSLSAVHDVSSLSTSRISPSPSCGPSVEACEHPAEIVERIQVVRGQKVVAVRQRRRHTSRQRLVALRTEQRGEPQQPGCPAPPGHQPPGKLPGIAPVPPPAGGGP